MHLAELLRDGIEARHGTRVRRALMAVALAWTAGAVASPLPAATQDLGTVPATLVRRFGVPIVYEVIGGENGGPDLALVSDLGLDDGSEYPSLAWWTRRPEQHRWSFFRRDAGLWVSWPGALLAVEPRDDLLRRRRLGPPPQHRQRGDLDAPRYAASR
jgi:hypothetical protein